MSEFELNQYGFQWKGCLVERTASHNKPRWLVLRVYALNGEVVEITMQARKTRVNVIPKEKKK